MDSIPLFTLIGIKSYVINKNLYFEYSIIILLMSEFCLVFFMKFLIKVQMISGIFVKYRVFVYNRVEILNINNQLSQIRIESI